MCEADPGERRWPLALVLALFVLLGAIYGLATPIYEAPDEHWHYFYVKRLADGQGLPVESWVDSGQRPCRQEGSQPPLYYLLVALTTFWIDDDDACRLAVRNPHADIGYALGDGNKNVFLHGNEESFPYRGAALGVHTARWVSTLLGALTVYFTYRLGRELLPQDPSLALLAAIFFAFIPQVVFLSAAVNNDNVIIVASAGTLVALARIIRRGFSTCRALLLGLALGLAALSKLSGLGLFPLAAFALAVNAWRMRAWKHYLQDVGLAFGLAFVVAGWWYLRNLALYGDWTGLRAMLDVAGRRAEPPSLSLLGYELQGLRISLWALFGWFNVRADEWMYHVFDVLLVVAALGLPLLFWRTCRDRGLWAGFQLTLPLLWMGLIFGGLMIWTSMTTGTQGRLLFPALPGVCVLLAGGLGQWVSPRFRGRFTLLLGSGLVIVAALVPFLYIMPAYARPPVWSPDSLPEKIQPIEICFGENFRLLGYRVSADRIEAGETLVVTLYWQALRETREDYSVFIHVLGRDGETIGQRDSYPGMGSYPTHLWRTDEVVEDTYRVPLRGEVPLPTLCKVDVGFWKLDTQAGLPAYDAQGRELGSAFFAEVVVVPDEAEPGFPSHATEYELGSTIQLVGYDLAPASVRPGEAITLTCYWRATAPVSEDYTVFVHLLDEEGEIRAQADGEPSGGYYPTSCWQVEEMVVDERCLELPQSGPAGRYRIAVGMYLLDSGERLPAFLGKMYLPDDRILLASVLTPP